MNVEHSGTLLLLYCSLKMHHPSILVTVAIGVMFSAPVIAFAPSVSLKARLKVANRVRHAGPHYHAGQVVSMAAENEGSRTRIEVRTNSLSQSRPMFWG